MFFYQVKLQIPFFKASLKEKCSNNHNIFPKYAFRVVVFSYPQYDRPPQKTTGRLVATPFLH
ncbi:hypothetical protein, partial [Klebsiella pneumoniae]